MLVSYWTQTAPGKDLKPFPLIPFQTEHRRLNGWPESIVHVETDVVMLMNLMALGLNFQWFDCTTPQHLSLPVRPTATQRKAAQEWVIIARKHLETVDNVSQQPADPCRVSLDCVRLVA